MYPVKKLSAISFLNVASVLVSHFELYFWKHSQTERTFLASDWSGISKDTSDFYRKVVVKMIYIEIALFLRVTGQDMLVDVFFIPNTLLFNEFPGHLSACFLQL